MAYYSDLDLELTKQTDGDITVDEDEDAVKNALMNIIETIRGSRRMLPEFGADLQSLLFEPLDDVTAQMIGERIIGGIETWDNRIEIQFLDIEPNYSDNMYRCRLTVKILTSEEVQSVNFILKAEE